jgi:cytochrome oxidase Cu insertion factor (SCO1/SenC/PrrC family)
MHTPKKARFALMLVFALAAPMAAAYTTQTLKMMLDAKGIDKSYVVTYQDANGKKMTPAAFVKAANVQPYAVRKDKTAHTATFYLADAAAIAERDAKIKAIMDRQIKPGQPVPDFHLVTVNGIKLDNAYLHGHTTLVNFFFTTCVPCVAETPILNQYMRNHPQMKTLAVTFDDADDAKKYVAQRKFAWPIVADAQPFIDQLGIGGYPTLVLVGPDGKVRKIDFSPNIAQQGKAMTLADLNRWIGTP